MRLSRRCSGAALVRRWRKRVGFVLIAMTVAWLQMALNRPTGGGVHHVVLLVAAAADSDRGIGVAAVGARAGRYRRRRWSVSWQCW
jgi:hypothetical protein